MPGASATIISRVYTSTTEQLEFNFIAGTDRNALHDPRSCLIGSGLQLIDLRTEPLPGAAGATIATCRAVDPAGHRDFDVAYMYYVDGKVINRPTQIRWAMLRGLLLGKKNAPAYFLEYTMPIAHGEPVPPGGHADLLNFAAAMWQSIRPQIERPSSPPLISKEGLGVVSLLSLSCSEERVGVRSAAANVPAGGNSLRTLGAMLVARYEHVRPSVISPLYLERGQAKQWGSAPPKGGEGWGCTGRRPSQNAAASRGECASAAMLAARYEQVRLPGGADA